MLLTFIPLEASTHPDVLPVYVPPTYVWSSTLCATGTVNLVGVDPYPISGPFSCSITYPCPSPAYSLTPSKIPSRYLEPTSQAQGKLSAPSNSLEITVATRQDLPPRLSFLFLLDAYYNGSSVLAVLLGSWRIPGSTLKTGVK